MVNRANTIQGRSVDRHPFSDREGLGVYIKGASVIAGQAETPGIVQTPEGDMTFQAGDYIVTDNPPTHVWPVRQQVFEMTYVLERRLEEGQYPTTEPKDEYKPDLSVPPTDVTIIKGRVDYSDPTSEPTTSDAPAASPKPTSRPASAPKPKGLKDRRGPANSTSLGLQDK